MNKKRNKIFVLVGGCLLFIMVIVAIIVSSNKEPVWSIKQELIDKKRNEEYESKRQRKNDLYNKYKYLKATKIKDKKSSEKFWRDLIALNFEPNGQYYFPSQNYGLGIERTPGHTEYYYMKTEDDNIVDLHITIYDDGDYYFDVTVR